MNTSDEASISVKSAGCSSVDKISRWVLESLILVGAGLPDVWGFSGSPIQ